jgi:hypothetical protein
MFVSDKIVFVELHKTGTSHIKKLLSKLLEGQNMGKHNPAPPDFFKDGRSFIGSVRNPWEWYISLWAFGCNRKGAVYFWLTRPKGQIRGLGWRSNPFKAASLLFTDLSGKPGKWKRCYSDVKDAMGFREWLRMMYNRKYRNDVGEEYNAWNMKFFCGFYTYRYLKLFCRNTDSRNFYQLATYSELKDFESSQCYINHFIRNEHLEIDIISVLESCGIVLSEQEKEMIFSSGRSNVSQGKQKAEYYYDKDTVKLVADREKLIIEKFGYTQPNI